MSAGIPEIVGASASLIVMSKLVIAVPPAASRAV